MLRRPVTLLGSGDEVVHVSEGVNVHGWPRYSDVLVLTPAELAAKLEAARGEGSNAVEIWELRFAIQKLVPRCLFPELHQYNDSWWCGFSDGKGGEHIREWAEEHGIEGNGFSAATPLTAVQAMWAAVQAAAPCACKSAEWDEEDCWYFVAPTHDHTESTPQKWIKPGDACPLCGEPLPAKPVSAMSIEEWAEELRGVRGWRGWCAKPPNSLRSVWAISAIQSGRIDPVYNGKGDTCLEAWCAAGVKFREEAANV